MWSRLLNVAFALLAALLGVGLLLVGAVLTFGVPMMERSALRPGVGALCFVAGGVCLVAVRPLSKGG